MRLLMTTLFLIVGITASSQSVHTITATIKDGNEKYIAVGDAVLYIKDSIAHHSPILDGIFGMTSVPTGNYQLEIIALGYKTHSEEIAVSMDLDLNFRLQEDSKMLEAVTVTAIRESIRYDNGNVQVNMINSIFAEQPSTLDALAMMPGIITDPVTQSLSLIGGGSPLLYIGNRNITIDELVSIPVTNIKTIEIIYNPSAKYEANGRSVLLVTLLKNQDDGINIELTENAVLRRRFSNYAGYNLSLRKSKIEFRHNFNYNALQLWEGGKTDLAVPKKDINIANDFLSLSTRPELVGGTGIYYQISDTDYLSVNSSLRTHNTTGDITSNSSTAIGSTIDTVEVLSEDTADRDFYTANVNYNKYLAKANTTIFTGLQWSQYHRGLTNEIYTDRPDSEPLLTQERDQDFNIEVLAVRLDMETQLTDNTALELGTNIYSGSSRAYQYFEFNNPRNTLERNYSYQEKNYAFYGQVVGSTSGINYTLGLRTESTSFYGKFDEETTPLIDRSQTNIFPRLNLSYRIDSLSSLNLNFSSSISRPDYLNASSITTYVTPYIEYQRNVNLVPSPARYLSINYQYSQQSVNITAYTRDNLVQQSVFFDEESERIINSPENFDLERGINLMLNNQFSYKNWSINTVARYSINQLKDERGVARKVTPYLYLYANNRIVLPRQFTISINAFAITSRDSGLYNRNGRFVVGVSASKRLGPLSISLNATDIFRQQNFEEVYTINDISNTNVYFGDIKSLSLSLRYSFGKIFRSNYQNDDVDENLNRMQ